MEKTKSKEWTHQKAKDKRMRTFPLLLRFLPSYCCCCYDCFCCCSCCYYSIGLLLFFFFFIFHKNGSTFKAISHNSPPCLFSSVDLCIVMVCATQSCCVVSFLSFIRSCCFFCSVKCFQLNTLFSLESCSSSSFAVYLLYALCLTLHCSIGLILFEFHWNWRIVVVFFYF